MKPENRRLVSSGAALTLIAVFLVLFVGSGARFAIGVTFKPIVEHFDWDRSTLGLAVAVFQVVSAITLFLSGYITDRVGPRSILISGMLISAIGIGLMGAISAPWHALVLYGIIFAVGNGAASTIPIGVLVTRIFPDRAALANAVAISGTSLGMLVMIALLAAILLHVSWQLVFLLLGVAHLAILPLLILAIPKANRSDGARRKPAAGFDMASAVRRREFWMLLVVYALCGFDDFFVTTHVVAYAQDRGMESLFAGNLLAVMGLTALLGVFATGAASDRFGPVWPAAISFVARIFVFALLMVDQSSISIAIFSLVFGASFLVTAPLTVVFVLQYFGKTHLGALTGLITMIHHICGGLGAYLGSAIFDFTGNYELVFPIMMLSSVIALLLLVFLRKESAFSVA
jgi:predicted MFS family arabinose efflux permease